MLTISKLQEEFTKRHPVVKQYRFKFSTPSVPMFIATLLAAILLILMAPVFVRSLNAQPLDLVIETLLDNGPTGDCERLRGAGANLTGELAVFCGLNTGGDPSSSGGGAGTPNTVPGVIQDRLEAVGDDPGNGSKADVESELSPGWSIFLSAEGEILDRDATDFEDGYDSDVWRVTLGTDYRLGEDGTIGLALTYSNHEGDFDGGGDFENDSYGFIAFGAFNPNEKMFLQATLGYAWKGYERARDVEGFLTDTPPDQILSGSVKGDFDGNEFSTGILLGYDHSVGNLTIGPRIGLDFIYTEFDGYREQGNTGLELVFQDTDETSFQSRVGFAGSLSFETGFGALLPQLSADWVHEFADPQRNLAFSFADDLNGIKFVYEDEKPDSDFFELAVGLTALLPNGWQPYLQFRTIVGHEFIDSYVGSIGLRLEL